MSKIAGICFIKIDGAQVEVKGNVEVPLNDVNREPVMGLSGLSGFKETAAEKYVKLTANFTSDFPMDAIRTNTNISVTAELANGKVYTLSQGFLAGETPIKGDEGEVELKFVGRDGVWQ